MRRLAFVRALAFVSILGCDKDSVDDDPPTKKKPKPKPTATATATSATSEATTDPPPPCPKSQPKEEAECDFPTTQSCWYPDHQRCRCTAKHAWHCDEQLPVKGPLLPPELSA